MSLLALQRDFHRHLVDVPGTIASRIAPAATPGLDVYHNAYRVQLTECMAETYAQTHAWLGGEGFIDAVRSHIEARPPSGWTLGAYGDAFDRTLARLYPDDPEIAELAQLEWLLAKAFEGADADALPLAMIGTVDWDLARVSFVPTLAVVPVRTNAGAIWSALVGETPPPAAEMLPEAGAMLVWRQDFTPCFRTIETIEQDAIQLMRGGMPFADLCATLVEARGEESGVALAGGMLGQWFADGLIAGVTVEDEPAPRL